MGKRVRNTVSEPRLSRTRLSRIFAQRSQPGRTEFRERLICDGFPITIFIFKSRINLYKSDICVTWTNWVGPPDRMIGWMCGVSLKERQPSTELRRRLGVDSRGNWGCEEKRQTEMAWTCGRKEWGRPRKITQVRRTLSADIRLPKVEPPGRPQPKDMLWTAQ